jgi:hypothetical protein
VLELGGELPRVAEQVVEHDRQQLGIGVGRQSVGDHDLDLAIELRALQALDRATRDRRDVDGLRTVLGT